MIASSLLPDKNVESLSKNELEWLVNNRLESFRRFSEMHDREYADSPTQDAYTEIEINDIAKEKLAVSNIRVEHVNVLIKNGVLINDFKQAIENGKFKKYFMKIIKQDNRLNNLHAAYVNNFLLIEIPDDTKLDKPLKLEVNKDNEGSSFNHIILIVGSNCKIDYYETYKSSKDGYNSDALEIIVGKNSKVNVYSLQNYSNVVNYNVKKSRVDSNSEIKWVVANIGGSKVMSIVDNDVVGEFAAAYNYGVFLGKNQHLDVTNNANHIARNTNGDIISKGVVFENGNSVYHGEINVENDARQVNSSLSSHTLVFPGGKANAIPSLKIKTNDVRVKHAAWISQIEEEKLFYLMSRGLSLDEARKEVVIGHYSSVIDKINDNIVREEIMNAILERG